MTRRERTEILITGSPKVAAALAAHITERYDVKVIEEPDAGLVMVKMREGAQRSLFYLGEVTVTEAKVQISQALGLGIVQGDNRELAYQLAVIDAAYNAGLPETAQWAVLLERERQRIADKANHHTAAVLKTKVSFESMDVS